MIYPVNEKNLELAAAAILKGDLAAFPTETVYGLGGDAFNPSALAKIFEAKQRPRFDPLIIHIADIAALENIADLSLLEKPLREKVGRLTALWPGPLTLILPKKPAVPDLATSGLATVAVRFPSHPAAQQLIRLSTGAVAAPSANRFGCLSPTQAEHVAEQLGDRVDIILDGGRTSVGVESTVLDMSFGAQGLPRTPRILRPGGVSREQIETLIGPVEAGGNSNTVTGDPASAGRPLSPGQLKSHYAPGVPLTVHSREEMIALKLDGSEGCLFFDGPSRDVWLAHQDAAGGNSPEHIRVLSEKGDAVEGAANLFAVLHQLDRIGLSGIRAELAPAGGLGDAINDRLSRAAAK
ncbi:threonylcarbamoyl-AMP synthase [Spirochaetia bacterium]|nr:threonylcarbamoyl-AMP synthase [Spirochaetia bacterium]